MDNDTLYKALELMAKDMVFYSQVCPIKSCPNTTVCETKSCIKRVIDEYICKAMEDKEGV